eukprot:scaffold31608_cov63-Phaeocystis_antarctica.AAC.8
MRTHLALSTVVLGFGTQAADRNTAANAEARWLLLRLHGGQRVSDRTNLRLREAWHVPSGLELEVELQHLSRLTRPLWEDLKGEKLLVHGLCFEWVARHPRSLARQRVDEVLRDTLCRQHPDGIHLICPSRRPGHCLLGGIKKELGPLHVLDGANLPECRQDLSVHLCEVERALVGLHELGRQLVGCQK